MMDTIEDFPGLQDLESLVFNSFIHQLTFGEALERFQVIR